MGAGQSMNPGEKLEQIRALAQELYVEFAAAAGYKNWNWAPIATRAIEAAEVFGWIFEERYKPQAAVPLENP